MKRVLLLIHKETGISPVLWLILALLNSATLIIFRHNFVPGEFGTLNTALAAIGLLTVPVLAVQQAFAWYFARNHPAARSWNIEAIRTAALPAIDTFAWVWAAISLVLVVAALPLLDLPRFSLNLFTLLNVLFALAGVVSSAICQNRNQVRLWSALLVLAALFRVVNGTCLATREPWAEAGLGVIFLAGFITVIPALRQPAIAAAQRWQAARAVLDRDFLVYLAATFSVLLAIFLFTNADRLVAQSWFGTPRITRGQNIIVTNIVNWFVFDGYQTAGLLGRALIWGTQPILLVFFAQRSRLEHTTRASLTWLWIYLGALVVGAIFLFIFAIPLSLLFCGPNYGNTEVLVPYFIGPMLVIGLLQGIGLFTLASRRYPECFALGGCSIIYTAVLYAAGRQADLMPVYMFGGGIIALMVVLFIGIVRWGRTQP